MFLFSVCSVFSVVNSLFFKLRSLRLPRSLRSLAMTARGNISARLMLRMKSVILVVARSVATRQSRSAPMRVLRHPPKSAPGSGAHRDEASVRQNGSPRGAPLRSESKAPP